MPTNNIFPTPNFSLNNNNNTQSIIWVNGYEEAKKYAMPKNSNAVLFDREVEGRFYIKITDDIGMYNIRFFNFEEVWPNRQQSNVQQQQTAVTQPNYITQEQFTQVISDLKNELKELKGALNNDQPVSRVITTTTPKYNVVKSAESV